MVAVEATGPLPEQALKARQVAASQGQVRGQRVGLRGVRTATEVKIIGLHSHKKTATGDHVPGCTTGCAGHADQRTRQRTRSVTSCEHKPGCHAP